MGPVLYLKDGVLYSKGLQRTLFLRVTVYILDPICKQNFYILVIMDFLTKWHAAIPITNKGAQIVAEALIDNWIPCFGAPHDTSLRL